VVDDPAGSLERVRDAPIAIASKLQNDVFDAITQLDICLVCLWSRLFFIVPGAADLQGLTELTDGSFRLVLMHLGNHRVSLLDPTWRKAFPLNTSVKKDKKHPPYLNPDELQRERRR